MPRVMSVFALGLIMLVSAGCAGSTDPLKGCVEVKGDFNPAAPGFIVSYQTGVDPVETTTRLEAKYAFSARHVYTALPGFAAQLGDAALAGVRCEAAAASISRDGIVTFAAH